MKIKTNVKFEYTNGRFRKITWVEDNPQVVTEQVDGEPVKKREATKKDIEYTMRTNLATMLRDKKVRSFYDSETNKIVIVDFSSVEEIEIDVEELEEEVRK